MPDFTKTEAAIIELLGDGQRHTKSQIIEGLGDPYTSDKAIWFHVYNIRKKLRPTGRDVLCEYYKGRFFYRLVRLVTVN